MKESKIEIQKLTAEQGMVLTNGEAFSKVGGSVFLSKNDKKENWEEITEQEAESRKAAADD